MVEQEGEQLEPLIQPRVPRLLKERPKLVGGGIREEFWEGLEQTMKERRQPDKVAEKTVREAFNQTADAAAPPVRDRVRDRLDNANSGILENL
jgi:hypothetical protein